MKELFQKIKDLDLNRRSMVATVVSGQYTGEKALFEENNLLYATVSNGFFEAHSKEFENIHKTQLISIGDNSVFCDLLNCEKKIVICGGGHVSIPVIRIGKMLGFHITVLEDRPMFADRAREAGADLVICDSFENGLAQIPGDNNTYFTIVTRGHRYDQECLRLIAKKTHAYIGMIGSRKRVRAVFDYLIETGTDPEIIKEVHSPIGINIHAETPEEIGVAIIAEIIDVKNSAMKDSGFTKELLKELTEEVSEERVLATIISRKGSAPREVGTKMMVFADGRCIGTIGGGCVEADVVGRARQILMLGLDGMEIYEADMRDGRAEEDGMVCGGIEEILFEKI